MRGIRGVVRFGLMAGGALMAVALANLPHPAAAQVKNCVNGAPLTQSGDFLSITTMLPDGLEEVLAEYFACQALRDSVIIGDHALGGIKVSENNSPRPRDRFTFAFDFFDNGGTLEARQTFGFEKAFLDGRSSFAMRLPLVEVPGSITFGDISLITKFLLFENGTGTSIVSAGLGVSVPTGPGVAQLQPWIGGQFGLGEGFVANGFVSLINPVGVAGGNILTGDLGLGYTIDWDALFAGRPLNIATVTPVVEIHYNNPLGSPGYELNLTVGSLFRFVGGADAFLGVGFPLGPFQPYDVAVTFGFNVPINCGGGDDDLGFLNRCSGNERIVQRMDRDLSRLLAGN